MTHSITNNLNLLRKLIKKQRETLTVQETSRGSLLSRGRIFTWIATNQARLKKEGKPTIKHIAAFWSVPEEIELQPLLEQWVNEHDYVISLPAIVDKDQPLEFRIWKPGSQMETGPYGILQPIGPIAPKPQVMLVPTLGFTRQGDRIGYGGGYYDRTISLLRQEGHTCTTLGVAWSVGDLNHDTYAEFMPYKPQPHDQPLDGIITDKGWPMPAPIL